MHFWSKRVAELTEGDFLDLVRNRIREDLYLEYKGQAYDRTEDATREMLRDITAMANSAGGHLVLGISKDPGDPDLPLSVDGIDDGPEQADRIVKVCLSSVQERIPGLEASPIALTNGKHVVVVRIPRSLRFPHLISFKGLNQFWNRHGNQKSPMSIDEIRSAFRQADGVSTDLRALTRERRDEILAGSGGGSIYSVSLTPECFREGLVPIRDTNVRTLLANPPDQRHLGWNLVICDAVVRPTFTGLVVEPGGRSKYRWIEVFRSGHMEFHARIDESQFRIGHVAHNGVDHPLLGSIPVSEFAVSFVRFARCLAKHLGLPPDTRWSIALSLRNVSGFGLVRRENRRGAVDPDYEGTFLSRPHLEVPPYLTEISPDSDAAIRPALDILWNAFGYDEAPYFDAKERFSVDSL